VSRAGRLGAASTAVGRSFLRRRTAVFFTFLFPLLIVLIFGVLVETGAGGGGLFAEPAGWYVPGYIAVVVLFTPLSRVGSEVARHRDGNRFEKLATTPLTRPEWVLAQTLVAVAVIGIAALLVLGMIAGFTGARVAIGPTTLLLVPYVALGVALFCGVGAVIGSLADSQDGVIAASNAIAIPLLFLSETFVPVSMLPDWLPTGVSPLTYFSRGVRAVTYHATGGEVLATHNAPDPVSNLVVLGVLAVLAVAAGAVALPVTD
jgi:ABC-2 type transport system permease protein